MRATEGSSQARIFVALIAVPAQGFVPIPHLSQLRPPPRYDATAVICDGVEIHEIPLTDLDQWFTDGDGIVLSAARCARVRIDNKRYLEPIPEDELHLTKNGRGAVGAGIPERGTAGDRRQTPRTAYRLLPMS